jgi:hypothetical protein
MGKDVINNQVTTIHVLHTTRRELVEGVGLILLERVGSLGLERVGTA